jgi:hypothetical protein
MKLQSRPDKEEPSKLIPAKDIEKMAVDLSILIPPSSFFGSVHGLLFGLKEVGKVEEYIARHEASDRRVIVYLQMDAQVERFSIDY